MRTVVTGLGIICAIGNNQAGVLESIKLGKSGIDEITLFDHTPFDRKLGGEIKNYESEKYFSEEECSSLNRCSQFSIIAIKEALAQAGLDLNNLDSRQVGLCLGTSHGAAEELFELYEILLGKKKGEVTPETGFNAEYYGLLKIISSYFGINGVSFLPSIACASGANAIGVATDLIKRGKAKFVLCGGSDAFDLPTFAGFWGLDAVSPDPTSPFSTGEFGITLGEGAAFFVVESLETARARRAAIVGEILGYGLTNDAHHATAPHPLGEGAKRCMERAVKNSGITRKAIEYINTHGTGTKANDEAEIQAIINFYEGDLDAIPPLSATKTLTGHATGAAGALELAICFLCVQKGILPPTLHFDKPRHAEGLDYIPNTFRRRKIQTFLSNSFGFAGCNASIIGARFNEERQHAKTCKDEKRVVITGIGGVCSVGIGKEEIWKAFEEKKTSLSKITLFDVSQRQATHASCIPNFNPRKYARRLDTRRMDRISQFASVAAFLCLQDANYKVAAKKVDEIGLIYAVAPGPMLGLGKHLEGLILKGPGHPSQVHFPYSTQNSSLGQLTVNLGIGGYSTNLVEGSASLGAMISAYEAIKLGYEQRIVAGGATEVFWNYHHGFEMRGELTSDEKLGEYSLFSSTPDGYIPGEGSAFLMVEEYESAQTRDVQIYGEIAGYGVSIDSNKENILFNDASGENLYWAMEMARQEAGIAREQIGLVLSSDRGIPSVAQAELNALRRFFGDHLRTIIYTTTRFNTGWLNSSSSVVNLISLLHAFTRGILLPIPHSELKTEPNEFRICKEPITIDDIEYGMVLKISREGTNAAMILKRSS